MYSGWGVGEGNGTCQLFCSWRSLPKIPALPTHTLILVYKYPSPIPQVFFKLLFLCYISAELFVVWSLLRVGTPNLYFYMLISSCPIPLVGRLLFPYQIVFIPFVEDQLTINVWVYFWTLNSLLLIYSIGLCISMPYHSVWITLAL